MSDTERRQMAGRAVRGGAVLMATRLGMQAFTWAVTLGVPRLIGTHDYGVMTWGVLVLGLTEILAESGLGRALVQKKDATAEDRDRVFTLSLSLAAALYLGTYAAADPIAAFVRMPEVGFFLRVLALTLWLVPLRTVALAVLDREQRLASQAVVHVLVAGVQAVLVLALALAGYGYWALAAGAMTAKVVEATSLLFASGWRPRLAWPGRESRALVSFGLYAAGATLLWFAYDNADFVVVGRMFGPDVLGVYALAFLLMTMPVQKLAVNINQVAYPVYCRLQDDRPRLTAWFLRLSVLVGAAGVPALTGMSLVADDAILLVYGPSWEAAILPFRLLAVVGMVRLYAVLQPPLFNAIGRPDVNLWRTLVLLVILPSAFIVGGAQGGLVGVCLGWLAVHPLSFAVMVWWTRDLTGFGILRFVRAQVPVIGATMTMAGAVLLARLWLPPGPLRLGISVLVGVVTYASVIGTLARTTVLADYRALWRELRGGAG